MESLIMLLIFLVEHDSKTFWEGEIITLSHGFLIRSLQSSCWMLDISGTASYETTLNFLKITSLVFSDIVHDDS